MVIDTSGSMSGEKLRLAKLAAKRSAKALLGKGLIGIIAFASRAKVILPLTKATKGLRLDAALAPLEAGGGTQILKALKKAHEEMNKVPAMARLVVLLTDGRCSWQGILEEARTMAKEGIVISTIAVGVNADARLLGRIAQITGGMAYQTLSMRDVVAIVLKEARRLGSKGWQTSNFTVLNATGFGPKRFPAVKGLSLTFPKKEARILLKTPDNRVVAGLIKRGNGRVAVFTPGIGGWSKQFFNSRKGLNWFREFVEQLIRPTDIKIFAQLTSKGEDLWRLDTDVFDRNYSYLSDIKGEVEFFFDGKKSLRKGLKLIAPGRYRAILKESTRPEYAVVKIKNIESKVYPQVMPSMELLGLGPDLKALERMGKVVKQPGEILKDRMENLRFIPLTKPFIALALLVFIAAVWFKERK